MDKKQKLILTFAIVVLIGAISFAVVEISVKNQSSSTNGNNSIQKPANMFGSDKNKTANMANVVGNVMIISEKTITIKKEDGTIAEVNINGTTPVLVPKDGQMKNGQMADLKVQDLVNVQYDAQTKNVQLISIIPPVAVKLAPFPTKTSVKIK